ncbi:MAG: SNF2-related protein [Rhodopila sp.]
MRPRSDLHPYQLDAIAFLKDDDARQLIAVMGSGKTTVAEHTLADLKQAGELEDPALVVAPLMIAETVWKAEAALWEDTAGLTVERVLGTSKQRLAALERPADIYVINYDNVKWLAREAVRRQLRFSVLIADESSKLKNPETQRTGIMQALGGIAQRRWTLTGTPRGHQLTDVWAPAQFVTNGTAFPPFYSWRAASFFTNDIYERRWFPRAGAEAAITAELKPFTHVVDQAALNTRPAVVEIVHDVPLDPASAAVYQALDEGGTTDAVAAKVAAGLIPASEMALVTKLMQVCSGASYDDKGGWTRLHDRRLDMLAEIHESHDRPTLVFISFHHELARIQERFPAARALTADRIDAWNAGNIEMLVAHPASAGHGVNLQHGSDTLVWFSLPWSAERYAQANARLVRQGQRSTVNIHVLLSRGRIDEIAHRVVHQRIADQDRLIGALQH